MASITLAGAACIKIPFFIFLDHYFVNTIIIFQFSHNSFNSNYDHIYPGFEVQKSPSKRNKAGDDDEAGKFKAEIRAVKGVLLSSRTFPASRKPVGGVGNIGMVGVR